MNTVRRFRRTRTYLEEGAGTRETVDEVGGSHTRELAQRSHVHVAGVTNLEGARGGAETASDGDGGLEVKPALDGNGDGADGASAEQLRRFDERVAVVDADDSVEEVGELERSAADSAADVKSTAGGRGRGRDA